MYPYNFYLKSVIGGSGDSPFLKNNFKTFSVIRKNFFILKEYLTYHFYRLKRSLLLKIKLSKSRKKKNRKFFRLKKIFFFLSSIEQFYKLKSFKSFYYKNLIFYPEKKKNYINPLRQPSLYKLKSTSFYKPSNYFIFFSKINQKYNFSVFNNVKSSKIQIYRKLFFFKSKLYKKNFKFLRLSKKFLLSTQASFKQRSVNLATNAFNTKNFIFYKNKIHLNLTHLFKVFNFYKTGNKNTLLPLIYKPYYLNFNLFFKETFFNYFSKFFFLKTVFKKKNFFFFEKYKTFSSSFRLSLLLNKCSYLNMSNCLFSVLKKFSKNYFQKIFF